MLVLCAIFFICVRVFRLARLPHTPWKRALGLGGLVGLVGTALHAFGDFPWHIPGVAFTGAAVAGMLAGVKYHADPFPLRKGQLARPALAAVLILIGAAELFLARSVAADLSASRAELPLYRQAARTAPWRPAYRKGLADLLIRESGHLNGYEREGLLRQAAGLYRGVLAQIPRDAGAADSLGTLLKGLGEVAEADRWFRAAVSNDPNNPIYWKHWGELMVLRGEGAEAAEAFRRAAGRQAGGG